tara:strand:- start:2047 stop:3048 length:1002 start_codon:yes stop_codon:yes gene_type:complete
LHNIFEHGVVIPDPTVCFGDSEYEPNTNEYPIIYDKLKDSLLDNNIKLFSNAIIELHKEIKSDAQVQKQLEAAIKGFALKYKYKNIKYSGPKTFDDLGYYTTTIDTDPLVKCLEKDIDDLKQRDPIRNTRVQDKIINLPHEHEIHEKINTLYSKLSIIKKPYEITDINLHISDANDTFNEYFQTDQRKKPKNKLYTLHIDPKHSYIKTIIYLNEVKNNNGPFAYVPESHRWYFDEVEMLFCKSNQLVNTLSNSSQRKSNASLPIWARKNSYFSRQLLDGAHTSETVYSKLKHFTTDETNFILFEPNHGWHRGTHVEDGERIALQVIMKPNELN